MTDSPHDNAFDLDFAHLTGNAPFPWQQRLFGRFKAGTIERSLDIPTGLGKTAVMAIWLLARAERAKVPRRLVYVVDRRAVVDQATDVAIQLRSSIDEHAGLKQALGIGSRSLPISTLRGQHVDNKEWLEDPSSPAIIVGTVDMIGSRLLFEGYGTSRKMRPYHAGLLGVDSLVVLDEAHLVPPFEKLLETIADGETTYGPSDEALRNLIPSLKLISLSATARAASSVSFGLEDEDLRHPVVSRRLDAPKHLSLSTLEGEMELADALAAEAWKLADDGATAVRVIVFSDKREDAAAARAAIEERAKGNKRVGILPIEVDTQLFVGGRRVLERQAAATWLRDRGFIAGSKVKPERPTFVFATSAGEVGVDLDADHMVSDLVAWERMVQRLGRVNRRGDGDARITVIVEPDPKPKKAVQQALDKAPSDRTKKDLGAIADHEATIEAARALQKPFGLLPRYSDGTINGSPGAIRSLKVSCEDRPHSSCDNDSQARASRRSVLEAATTPSPLRPALSRALVDAWSMTSLEEHTGRPQIDPWLRGWKSDPPQTSVAWRAHLPVREGGDVPDEEIKGFFEAAPPHGSEILETETFRVTKWLSIRAQSLWQASSAEKSTSSEENEAGQSRIRGSELMALALSPAGDLRKRLTFEDLKRLDLDYREEEKRARQSSRAFWHFLHEAMLIVDARVGGLKLGLLDEDEDDSPVTADNGDPWPGVRFRVRVADVNDLQPADQRNWRPRYRFAQSLTAEGDPARLLIIEKFRNDATTEEDRSAGRPQFLEEHQQWVEGRARELGRQVGLKGEYIEMLATAGHLHDEGKRALRWQRAFNAPRDRDYAKTLGPLNTALLDGYRHEFGSLPVAEKNANYLKLRPELRDLLLHLIAAHHGFGRPLIGVGGCEDAPPSVLEDRARQVAMRFGRLQKLWGPWGLAWWEALLRAADQQASRDNEAVETVKESE